MSSWSLLLFFFGSWTLRFVAVPQVHALSGPIKSRPFTRERPQEKPKLILIGGCSGTGKSTFGMSVALDQGILKCISTDTLRSVIRSFVTQDISPALHRSSFEPSMDDGSDNPVKSWKQTCAVLRHSVNELVDEMIRRRASIVIEGVHIIPDNDLLNRWEASGGVATGVMLQISDEEAHKGLLKRRGVMNGREERTKLEMFDRIRAIHDEMVRLAKEKEWVIIEQNLQPDPLEIVASHMWQGEALDYVSAEQLTSRSQRRSAEFWTVTNGDPTLEEGKHISSNESQQ